MENQSEMAQPAAAVEQQEHHEHRHGGRPWPKGVSGNPSGSTVSKRFAALYASMLAEFGDAVLTASDRALLAQACRLLCRRMRDDEIAVKATNAARHIVNSLHERYPQAAGTEGHAFSPMRDRLAREVAAEEAS
jgi:hypothetical protein